MVAAVDEDPEAASEVAYIYIPILNKNKGLCSALGKTSSTMIRKGQQVICGRLGRILSTILAPSTVTTSEMNYRTK